MPSNAKVVSVKIVCSLMVLAVLISVSVIADKVFATSSQWLFLSLLIVYASCCFSRIKGEFKGIKEIAGIPYGFIDSGPHWIWFPVEKIILFPKQEQRIDIEDQQVITKEVDEISAVALPRVSATFYFFWPDDESLVDAYKYGPNPNNAREIKLFFEDAINESIGEVGGSQTWVDCYQRRAEYAHKIAIALSPEKNPHGPVVKSKITTFRVVIPHVELPSDLKKAITAPLIAAFNKKATIEDGLGQSEKIKLIGQGSAAMRQAIFDEIAKQGNAGLAYEMLLTLREMANGKSSTIFYGLPSGLNDVLSSVLGGKKGTGQDIEKLLGGKEGIQELMKNLAGLTGGKK